MADLTSEDFDPIVWANKSMATRGAEALLTELRSEWSNAHAELSSALSDALGTVPWCVREADRVRQLGGNLREGVDGVSERVEGVETGAEEAVASIASADAVLRRVEQAKDMLTRAVEIDTLADRIEAIFVGGDLLAVADSMAKMRENVDALRNVPEIEAKRKVLEAADQRLNSMAEPQLQSALQTHSVEGARSALEVFRKSGREDAFLNICVSFRSSRVRAKWSSEITKAAAGGGNATQVLFQEITEVLDREAQWFQEAMPELRPALLPALIIDILSGLDPPLRLELPRGMESNPSLAASVDAQMRENALSAVALARKVGKLCLESPSPKGEGSVDPMMIHGACDAVMAPAVAYFESFSVLERMHATRRLNALVQRAPPDVEQMSSVLLGEMVRESSEVLLAAGKEVGRRCLERTRGALLGASFDAQRSVAILFSTKTEQLLRSTSSRKTIDWIGVQGALSLLTMLASLARSWSQMKDTLASEAMIAAMPFVETASAVAQEDADLLAEFLSYESDSDAAIIWCLARGPALRQRVVTSLQTFESNLSDRTGGDLRNILKQAKDLVYEGMFHTIRTCLEGLSDVKEFSSDTRASEGASGAGGAAEVEIPEFSLAPLPYATEIGEHLLTVPLQLEPYIPEEEDAILALPDGAANDTRGGSGDGEINFAQRWVSSIAHGTMQLYVERTLMLPKLSYSGASQLSVDLEYVCSVISALGVTITPAILGVRAVLQTENIVEAVQAMESPEAKRAASRTASLLRGVSVPM